jgi:hypothetical protein
MHVSGNRSPRAGTFLVSAFPGPSRRPGGRNPSPHGMTVGAVDYLDVHERTPPPQSTQRRRAGLSVTNSRDESGRMIAVGAHRPSSHACRLQHRSGLMRTGTRPRSSVPASVPASRQTATATQDRATKTTHPFGHTFAGSPPGHLRVRFAPRVPAGSLVPAPPTEATVPKDRGAPPWPGDTWVKTRHRRSGV